ncbi:ABC transporter permease [Phaeocystidibacter luteus]|uniref:ABC transporter permease n=1 Tax=Phaeocystidibacter luteus TaxID=911197 RepID=A0A6N6RFD8_9FLAO|nr:ABC transporter permease [Phaeocystidibacter luteus]KAB2807039.1 ABC transporter permease [Phaeocystidibacter luteus]
MNLPFHIARRYLFAKKSTNAVNWITGISALGVLVGTAAMVVVLSAFAGLDNLVRSFYTSFDPDIKITPAEGKFAVWNDSLESIVFSFDYVETTSQVVEDKALFRFREREYIAQIKGVDANYQAVSQIDSFIIRGKYLNPESADPTAVFGSGVASFIGLRSLETMDPVHVYVPKMGSVDRINPMGNVRFQLIYPSGFFQIQPEFDTKYVFVSQSYAQRLFGLNPDKVSGIEIRLAPKTDLEDAVEDLQEKMGEEWVVKNRDDLQVSIFKVLKSEGLITFLVLTFILIVASFGILSSVNILILEKRKDLHTLWSMGATEKLLRRIFMAEGLLISLGGASIGFILGLVIVLLQKHVGLLAMGSGYIVEYYPVEIRMADMLQILATILIVGLSISWLAVRRLKVSGLSQN